MRTAIVGGGAAGFFLAVNLKEMDINPLLADENDVVAVDARILIEK